MATGPGGRWSDLLEDAFQSTEVSGEASWGTLRGWLERHGADAGLVEVIEHAEQDGHAFPAHAEDAVQVLGAYGIGGPGGAYAPGAGNRLVDRPQNPTPVDPSENAPDTQP